MCVTSLLCSPRADLWPFYGFYVNGFFSIYKVYVIYRVPVIYRLQKRECRCSYFELGATCGGAGPVTQSHWTAAVERTLIFSVTD